MFTDFKSFISAYKDYASPMGDFAHDVTRVRDFPDNEQTYERLLQYFEYQSRINHNPDVLRLFKIAWSFYREASESRTL